MIARSKQRQKKWMSYSKAIFMAKTNFLIILSLKANLEIIE